MTITQTRRRFLSTLSMAGAAGLLRPPASHAAAGALETTTVRIAKNASICIAPQYVAEEFLRAEGFTDIRYVEWSPGAPERLASGRVDFSAVNPWWGRHEDR